MNNHTTALNGASSDSPRVHEAAIQKAVREAVLMHAHQGRAVPVSRDGKVVWLTPEEILAKFKEIEKVENSSQIEHPSGSARV
jgi:hypothetical protein